ncbi:Protein of unknown function (DUF1674) [Bartonella sp. CDC_skunk]|uniref:DUF1674 domain-containing protein n=1 Tax=Bartonella rochalimae ATCC BAA-1498 TaxID=685782 RepID=E6YNL3_9HYPH|nr:MULTISPECIES: DUF1674 domain-containing protein [Bartonella]AQX21981.1 Protein of unknown function (DUF1674) [Bartonella sp. CDC_skunk]AQX22198.1 Protein of unknown function (DUF1674) [Bartonella sp. 11B]AQX24520.1 Protein of unknown function (DUF1674) [Bartonella sp. 114]AQX25967.1 Protein of unknown function (DUF1674) [Bartonella sp. Coyote22sub2]AQX27254.1 Protein of unknown function (DUF1674) [Bartonella sp. Raccoon60]
MNKKDKKMRTQNTTIPQHTPIPPEAQRALQEAEERRKCATNENQPLENGGRGGKDPARYGDWEINGRAIDF